MPAIAPERRGALGGLGERARAREKTRWMGGMIASARAIARRARTNGGGSGRDAREDARRASRDRATRESDGKRSKDLERREIARQCQQSRHRTSTVQDGNRRRERAEGKGGGAKTRARGRGSARGAPLRDEIRGYGVGRGRVRRARASEVRAEGGDARASAPPRPSTKNFPNLSFGRWWAAARFDSNRLADQSLSASHRSTVRIQRYEGENSSGSPGPRSRRSRRSRRASSETGLSGARLDFADVSVDARPGTRRAKMAKVEPVRRASGRRRCCPFPR